MPLWGAVPGVDGLVERTKLVERARIRNDMQEDGTEETREESERSPMTCPDCNGAGAKLDSEIELWILCGTCDGDGFVWTIGE